MSDIAIIGAGAAGLAAAIFAAEQGNGLTVHLLDSAKAIGAKILISGGGRCNVTHDVVTPEDFHGNRHIIRNVLAAFDAERARRWFASLGVELKREKTGKLFPATDRARTVLDALIGRCRDLGVVFHIGYRVTRVTYHETGEDAGAGLRFEIYYDQGMLKAKRVILATGGRYNPSTNAWTATPTTGAPAARHQHSAEWTGSRMIVWGGDGNGPLLDTGGVLDPVAGTWSATSTTGAPSARRFHTAVWNGNIMIVWGGISAAGTGHGACAWTV